MRNDCAQIEPSHSTTLPEAWGNAIFKGNFGKEAMCFAIAFAHILFVHPSPPVSPLSQTWLLGPPTCSSSQPVALSCQRYYITPPPQDLFFSCHGPPSTFVTHAHTLPHSQFSLRNMAGQERECWTSGSPVSYCKPKAS